MTPRPYVALDRDGTIVVERNYLSDPEQLELLPGVAAGLRHMRQLGLGLVVVTNQSAVGRGIINEAQLSAIHQRLVAMLADEGIALDGIFACPHRPEDDCSCRKPRTGLIEQASGALGCDARAAFVIGDNAGDIELGRRIGATTLLVRTGYGSRMEVELPEIADYVVDDLAAAALVIEGIIESHQGRSARPIGATRPEFGA